MAKHYIRRLMTMVLAVFLIAGFLLVDSSAQKRRKRRRSSRRITNPAIYQPDNTNTNADASNLNSTETNSNDTPPTRPTTDQDPEAMQKTINTLSNQVDKLTNKITQMEESQRSLVDLERLSRAEQRATALRTELREVQAKQVELQARAEQLDYDMKPENIERSVAGYGTTHPEDLREQRRRQLENEKQRVSKQLDQLNAGSAKLEEAIATADAEIERLHKKLDVADEAAIQNAKTKSQAEGSMPRPSPTPTPFGPR